MVLVGLWSRLTGLQFFDTPALFAIGALFDTFAISALVHLLLAFPAGRARGPRLRGGSSSSARSPARCSCRCCW